MRKKLNLTIDEKLYKILKRKKYNISRYVENLIFNEIVFGNVNHGGCQTSNSGSNPGGAIFLTQTSSRDTNSEKNIQKHTYNSIVFNKNKYFEWIDTKGFSKKHTTQLKSYFCKHLENKTFNSPLELKKYIFEKTIAIERITKTSRSYLNYCEDSEIYEIDLLEKYRKILKFKRNRGDYHVPMDEDVKKNYQIMKRNKTLELIYLILATSGIRYIECFNFLKTYQKEKFKIYDNYVVYSINIMRGAKNINSIYLPKFVYEKLFHIDYTYDGLRRHYNNQKPIFSMKYLRKWQYNFLLFNGVPESVSDFIQGRASKSISSNHYLAKSQQADFWYEKVVEKFELIV